MLACEPGLCLPAVKNHVTMERIWSEKYHVFRKKFAKAQDINVLHTCVLQVYLLQTKFSLSLKAPRNVCHDISDCLCRSLRI